MAMVEIPRRVEDPSWPAVKWPYKVYPWKDPTYRDSDGARLPDFIPLIDPSPPKGKFIWLPSYNGLPSMDSIVQHPHRDYVWLMQGKDKKLKNTGHPVLPNYYNSEYMYVRHFDQEYVYHGRGKFFDSIWCIPRYTEYSNRLYVKERLDFNRWGPKSLNHLVAPFRILFDSRTQHPTSNFCYSVVRVDPHVTTSFRRKFYCNKWDKNVLPMSYMVEFAATDKNHIIIVEQSPLASLVMQRIMFGSNLNSTCMWMSLATIITANYRSRWPSLYVFPCCISVYCWYIYNWEYRKDPCWRYGFWTTWVNDPFEHEVFQHIDVYPDLLRQERMTFMQLEATEFRKPMNDFFIKVSVLVVLKTLLNRIQYRDSADTLIWEALKDRICTKTGSSIRYLHNLMDPINARCTFDDEISAPGRFLFWASFLTMYLFFIPPLIGRIKKRFDLKTRSRYLINQVSYRAMKGERRYMRLIQPMYWIYRWSWPRDEIGERDKWFLSQKYRHTPGSHQFYF